MSGRSRSDEGSVLALVLMIIAVFGVLSAAVASYATISFRRTVVTERRTSLVQAADAGIAWALDQARRDPSFCGQGSPPTRTLAVPVNGADVTIDCEVLDGLARGVDGYAAVLTDATATPAIVGRDAVTIEGPVHVADRTRTVSPSTRLTIVGGDLQARLGCVEGTSALPTGVTVDPSPPFGLDCVDLSHTTGLVRGPVLPDYRSVLTGSAALPDAPLPVDVDSCRVWFPGRYRAGSGPDLTERTGQRGNNRYHYFVSGTYQFDADVVVRSSAVIGGTPAPRDGPVLAALDPQALGSCAGLVDSHPSVAAAIAGLSPGHRALIHGTGVTWVFTGGADLQLEQGALVELFTRTTDQAVEAGVLGRSVVIVRDVVNPSVSAYPASTVTRAIDQIHPTAGLVLHGQVWAPGAEVRLRDTTAGGGASLRGGAVVGRLDLADVPAGRTAVALGSSPFDRTVRVTSTATLDGRQLRSGLEVVLSGDPAQLPAIVAQWVE